MPSKYDAPPLASKKENDTVFYLYFLLCFLLQVHFDEDTFADSFT